MISEFVISEKYYAEAKAIYAKYSKSIAIRKLDSETV
jgi:hypothetical protein